MHFHMHVLLCLNFHNYYGYRLLGSLLLNSELLIIPG
jgi:hypothetical protein